MVTLNLSSVMTRIAAAQMAMNLEMSKRLNRLFDEKWDRPRTTFDALGDRYYRTLTPWATGAHRVGAIVNVRKPERWKMTGLRKVGKPFTVAGRFAVNP